MGRTLTESASHYGQKAMYTLGYLGTTGVLIKTSYDVLVEKDLSHIFESLEALAILALGTRSIHNRHELNAFLNYDTALYKHFLYFCNAFITQLISGNRIDHFNEGKTVKIRISFCKKY